MWLTVIKNLIQGQKKAKGSQFSHLHYCNVCRGAHFSINLSSTSFFMSCARARTAAAPPLRLPLPRPRTRTCTPAPATSRTAGPAPPPRPPPPPRLRSVGRSVGLTAAAVGFERSPSSLSLCAEFVRLILSDRLTSGRKEGRKEERGEVQVLSGVFDILI